MHMCYNPLIIFTALLCEPVDPLNIITACMHMRMYCNPLIIITVLLCDLIEPVDPLITFIALLFEHVYPSKEPVDHCYAITALPLTDQSHIYIHEHNYVLKAR